MIKLSQRDIKTIYSQLDMGKIIEGGFITPDGRMIETRPNSHAQWIFNNLNYLNNVEHIDFDYDYTEGKDIKKEFIKKSGWIRVRIFHFGEKPTIEFEMDDLNKRKDSIINFLKKQSLENSHFILIDMIVGRYSGVKLL